MLDQSYTPQNLARLITINDISKFNLGRNREEVQSSMSDICQKINVPRFYFKSLLEKNNGGNKIFIIDQVEDHFAIKKLNDNLKRLYKIKQTDRNLVIKQISTLLKEPIPMFIIKLDIEKYYENIDRESILSKLKNDSLLSFQSKVILENFVTIKQIQNISGLPRGINISASMSEIFMRDFDRKINLLNGVYYYARYVDDIIIFAFDRPNEIIKEVEDILFKENKLKLNSNKTKLLKRVSCRCKPKCLCTGTCNCRDKCQCKKVFQTQEFEYLGYKFIFSDITEYSDKLIITIADKKIKKIKTRIIKSILEFTKTKDLDLLEKRISFLTGNYIVKDSSNWGVLKAGIYYNYQLINDMNTLDDLTIFLRKALTSKNNSYGKKVQRGYLYKNSNILAKYCFRAGFKNRKEKSFTLNEAITIKRCWSHD